MSLSLSIHSKESLLDTCCSTRHLDNVPTQIPFDIVAIPCMSHTRSVLLSLLRFWVVKIETPCSMSIDLRTIRSSFGLLDAVLGHHKTVFYLIEFLKV